MLLEAALRLTLKCVPPVLVRAAVGEFVPVFMLHRLAEPNGEPCTEKIQRVKAYLEYLRFNKYHLISLDDLIDKIIQREPIAYRTAVFTIDDGFLEQTEIAGELFANYDCPVTLFVITDFIEGKLWPWDDQVKHVLLSTKEARFTVPLPNGNEYIFDVTAGSRKEQSHRLQALLKTCSHTHIYRWLEDFYTAAGMEYSTTPPTGYLPTDWSRLEAFMRRGHHVGAHTKTHRILAKLSDEEARTEIAESIRVLNQKLPSASSCFAYPTGRAGDFLPRDQQIVTELGCKCAVSTIPKTATRESTFSDFPRYSLPENMRNFLQYLSFIEHLKNSFRAA